jgi:hypothetical protein
MMLLGPHRDHRVRRGVLVAFIPLLLSLGCATAEDTTPPATADPSTTTGTSEAPGIELIDRLLAIDDVRPLPAFGLDTREQPVLDPQQFALATLRGPCGATIETPFDESGVFRVFRSTVSLIVEAVAEPGAAAAEAFVEQLRADAEPGCPPFTEQLGSAEPSTIQLQAMLELDELGEGWIGWTQEVTASTGRVGFRSILVAAEGDRLWLLAVLSPDPISANELVALGELASQRAAAG